MGSNLVADTTGAASLTFLTNLVVELKYCYPAIL
jgi:hypothetical protein